MHISNEQGFKIAHLFPNYFTSNKEGRPQLNRKRVFEGILHAFKENILWKAVPKIYGSGSALNEYFRAWSKCGVFYRLKEGRFRLISFLDWEKIDFLRKAQKVVVTKDRPLEGPTKLSKSLNGGEILT